MCCYVHRTQQQVHCNLSHKPELATGTFVPVES
jgi:hypothetical protein